MESVDVGAVRSEDELGEAWRFLTGVFPQIERPGFPRSLDFYRSRRLAQPDLMVVARAGAQLVGAALASLDGERVLMGEVAVAEEWRGRGIGSRMVASIVVAADRAGAGEILVGAADDDAAAFYSRNGFDASLFIDCRGTDDPFDRRERLLKGPLAGHEVRWRGGDATSARATVACDGVDIGLRDTIARDMAGDGTVGFVMTRRAPREAP